MDNHTPLVIRKAGPSFEEGLAFARYADEITEGYLRFMFGPQVLSILAEAYGHPNHEYSYQNVVFAEQDNRLVGMASGYTINQHHHFDERPLQPIAGYNSRRVKAVKFLSSPLIQILKNIPAETYYLLFIGVDKEMRGKGVGALLLEAVEQTARSAGAARLSLDVSAKNAGAKKLYEKNGMSLQSQWPKHFSLGGFSLLRMTKQL